MKRILLTALTAAALQGCGTLNKTEISNLKRTPFEVLQLTPAYDLYAFRFDIIRQQREDWTSDSTHYSEDIEYHRLGFQLGNGLYYDLNDHLSIDLLTLLAVDIERDFEASKVYNKRRMQARGVLSRDGMICSGYRSLEKIRPGQCRYVERAGGTVAVRRRAGEDKAAYYIRTSEDTLSWLNRREKVQARIYQTGEGQYVEGVRRPRTDYRLTANRVDLGRYVIEMNASGEEIHVLRQNRNKKRTRLLYQMIRGEDRLYVFGPTYRGHLLEFTDEGLTVYRNGRKRYDVVVRSSVGDVEMEYGL